MTIKQCPKCRADLGYEDKDDDAVTWYTRAIGIEVRTVYDGVLYWRCPECDGQWHYWAKGTELGELADAVMSQTSRLAQLAHLDQPRPVLPRRDEMRSGPADDAPADSPLQETP